VYQDEGSVAHATGFLVSPALVLTANHVLPNADVCERACIEFNYEDGADGRLRTPISVHFEPSDFFITDPKMDFSLVALKDRDAGRKFGWTRLSEDEVTALVGESLSIVQHSGGTPKQVALRELCIIDISDPYFYCEARTVVGSPGAPLFNDQWEVVGMHRLALPSVAQKRRGSVRLSPPKENETKLEYARMEVLRVSRILKAIRAMTLSKNQEILREEMLFAKLSGSIGAVSV
jgi:endonuclease G, mitochondrial